MKNFIKTNKLDLGLTALITISSLFAFQSILAAIVIGVLYFYGIMNLKEVRKHKEKRYDALYNVRVLEHKLSLICDDCKEKINSRRKYG